MKANAHHPVHFLIPAIVSVCFGAYDVSVATLLCLGTSLYYYSDETNKRARLLDMVVVNGIAAMYTLRACWLSLIPSTHPNYMPIVPFVSICTLYVYFSTKSGRMPEHYHWLVHVIASLGICCYIAASC